MKLRTALAGAVGAVGATAAANRLLRSPAGDGAPFLAGDHGTYRWRGFDVSYTEAGDPEDPDLLLFHGINAAASSHEFHTVFGRLAEEYHVIAPDLPGFGRSDRPPLLYSASLYETFVADAIEDLGDDPVVVGSSLTGAYVANAVNEEALEIDRLVLVCPTDTSMGGRRVWLRSLMRSPVVGEALHNLGGFLDPEADLGETLAALEGVTLVWGRDAEVTPLSVGEDLAERADARLVVFDDALLLPHVEHPAAFVDVVRGDLERVEAGAGAEA